MYVCICQCMYGVYMSIYWHRERNMNVSLQSFANVCVFFFLFWKKSILPWSVFLKFSVFFSICHSSSLDRTVYLLQIYWPWMLESFSFEFAACKSMVRSMLTDNIHMRTHIRTSIDRCVHTCSLVLEGRDCMYWSMDVCMYVHVHVYMSITMDWWMEDGTFLLLSHVPIGRKIVSISLHAAFLPHPSICSTKHFGYVLSSHPRHIVSKNHPFISDSENKKKRPIDCMMWGPWLFYMILSHGYGLWSHYDENVHDKC
jgi:hypothetical protein